MSDSGHPSEEPNAIPVERATFREDAKAGVHMPSTRFLEKGAQAVALANSGKSYSQIAAELGCSKSTAHAYVVTTLRWSVGQAGAEEVFWNTVARLNAALGAIWPKVLEGDYQAIDRFLRIEATRRSLYGLDAPTKIRLEQVSEEAIDQAIEDRRSALRLLAGGAADTETG